MGYNQHNAGLHFKKVEKYGKYDDLKFYEEKAFGTFVGKSKKGMGEDPRFSTEEWKAFMKIPKMDPIRYTEIDEKKKEIFLMCNGKNSLLFREYVPKQAYNDFCEVIKGRRNDTLMFDLYLILTKLGVRTIGMESLEKLCKHFQEHMGTILIETRHFPNIENFDKGLYYYLSGKIRDYLYYNE